ncbi:hypothetical protein K438DRAFT_1766845 [Mycena galopus ATCC 62051]|nr:hypothetical protein K438DRAFT_1766845 [Mycena galopus ATCC 62051]
MYLKENRGEEIDVLTFGSSLDVPDVDWTPAPSEGGRGGLRLKCQASRVVTSSGNREFGIATGSGEKGGVEVNRAQGTRKTEIREKASGKSLDCSARTGASRKQSGDQKTGTEKNRDGCAVGRRERAQRAGRGRVSWWPASTVLAVRMFEAPRRREREGVLIRFSMAQPSAPSAARRPAAPRPRKGQRPGV